MPLVMSCIYCFKKIESSEDFERIAIEKGVEKYAHQKCHEEAMKEPKVLIAPIRRSGRGF
jgi:hypothetical protein